MKETTIYKAFGILLIAYMVINGISGFVMGRHLIPAISREQFFFVFPLLALVHVFYVWKSILSRLAYRAVFAFVCAGIFCYIAWQFVGLGIQLSIMISLLVFALLLLRIKEPVTHFIVVMLFASAYLFLFKANLIFSLLPILIFSPYLVYVLRETNTFCCEQELNSKPFEKQ